MGPATKETVMKIHELFAYIAVKNAPKAIEFYKAAFGAEEKFRLVEPSGRVGHAELAFGGTILMLSDEYPEFGIRGPDGLAATPVTIHLHVDNADEFIAHAAAAGGVGGPPDCAHSSRAARLHRA